jgi:uncharacterized protein YndB with AHSA1/START domain
VKEKEIIVKSTESLEVTTPSDREITMTRVFDADCGQVFEAYTNPELVRRWLLGPHGWTMPVCEIDLKIGGTFRYVWSAPDKTDLAMRGVYKEIIRPERIDHTESFDEDCEGGEALVTTTFSQCGCKTAVTTTVRYSSREVRDAILNSGMEQGVAASYDRLEQMLPGKP